MPVETAVYVSDLVSSNPPTSDLETQGANHLQLIKTVLQNTFGTATRRFVGLPQTKVVSSGGTFAPSDAGTTFLANTAGGSIAYTLPTTLLATDAGWEISIIKTSTDANPVFISPFTGTMQSGEIAGLTRIRRCIPGRRTRITWTGSSFFAERVNQQPVGSLLDTGNATLAVGYEWPNGQTLSSALNYPEYFAVFGGGVTPDIRGRAIFGLDNMGGSAAGRITVAGGNYDGTINGGVGGLEKHTLLLAEAPTGQFTHTFTDPGHTHNLQINGVGSSNSVTVGVQGIGVSGGGGNGICNGATLSDVSANTGITSTITDHAGGGSHTILPPAISLGKLLIVE